MIITKYQIEKAKKHKPIWNDSLNCFHCEGYDLRNNKKNDWSCTCKYYSDGKTQNKPCCHILSIYYFYEKETFNLLKEKAIKKHREELDYLENGK